MMARLLSRLGVVRGVWLEDYRHEIYGTWARKSPFGRVMAYVYPWHKIGCVLLCEDGTVPNSYIKRWKWMHGEGS